MSIKKTLNVLNVNPYAAEEESSARMPDEQTFNVTPELEGYFTETWFN